MYRLIYFDSRGAAELTRYLLAVVEAPYDDLRYPLHATPHGFGLAASSSSSSSSFLRDQQAGAFRCNMDKLPVLQVLSTDGKAALATLGQSHAINRFLAERHGLFGHDLMQRTQIDAIYESVRDIKSDFLRVKRINPKDRSRWVEHVLPTHCQKLEASLPTIAIPKDKTADNNYTNPWLFGGDMPSLADVAVFSLLGTATSIVTGSLVTSLDDIDPSSALSLSTCPRLVASVAAMQALPAIQAWHAKRPDSFS